MNILEKQRTEDALSVGIAIRANRVEQGWSQLELGKRANLSREFICMVETRKRSPSLGALSRIATCFGKNSVDLFNEIGDADERLELAMRLRELARSGDTASLKKLLEFVQTL